MSDVHAGRLARLRAAMVVEGVDAFLVTAPTSVRYLSGYGGSNGVTLVLRDGARFFTDFRYASAVEPLGVLFDVRVVDQNLVAALAGDWPGLVGTGRIGFEANAVSYAGWRRLDDAARAAGAELVATTGVVEAIRAVKSAEEVDRLRRAAAIADQVYDAIADEGLAGRTEREVAWAIQRQLRELGADGASFPPIVAAADNGALPHAEPRDVEIPRGTLVVIDLGALLDGYCSDCTRTFATGSTTQEMKDVYEVVLRAQETALALVEPGRPCLEVHEAASRVISEAGYGDFFNHGTGHGVGIDVHEEPRFRTGYGGTLEPGNVVTVEPGIYLPGRFGVRIEDLAVVTESGHEVLTQFPKSLTDAG